MVNKPELLAPAGSFEALKAAISAGADAVYFGATSFNARNRAENFNHEELEQAIRLCRIHGVKTNITVNTQLLDREIPDGLNLIGDLLRMGADAFIIADLGLATAVKQKYPQAIIHASTQASGQNVISAKALQSIGFSRMVAPRELSFEDIKILTENSPIEIEIFIHGALCMSFSGQCLMSSVIGGRSGNRGECAQPCRLPYKCKCQYPLSLKDSCLASHIKDILSMNVASLKIEGRMKNPEYVYRVTSIYRKLLDEERNATEAEVKMLSDLFSRSGFTDGYFKNKIDSSMLGIRTDDQKKNSTYVEKTSFEISKVPVCIKGDFSSECACIEASTSRNGNIITAKVKGEGFVEEMKQVPHERLEDALKKCGGTEFVAEKVEIVDGIGAKIPVSTINALRREVLSKLESMLVGNNELEIRKLSNDGEKRVLSPLKTAEFYDSNAITSSALEYFDAIFVPLTEYVNDKISSDKIGIAMPPIVFDTELEYIRKCVQKAKSLGCNKMLVTSLWQAFEYRNDFELFGDIRLNVWNKHSLAAINDFGINHIVASSENDLKYDSHLSSGISAVAYGRVPVMTMQKCAIKELLGINSRDCHYCDSNKGATLVDRTGAAFPIIRIFEHRNVIFNSVPYWMCDRLDEYDRNKMGQHFMFTIESPKDVDKILRMSIERKPCEEKFKRL